MIGPSLGPSYGPSELAAGGAAVTGTMYVPVIPGIYTDRDVPFSEASYQDRLFGGGSGGVSVTSLYSEMSFGTSTISGTVLPWLAMPEPASFYEPPLVDEKLGNVIWFLFHALQGADPEPVNDNGTLYGIN